MAFLPARWISRQSPEGDDDTGNGHDDDDDYVDDDDGGGNVDGDELECANVKYWFGQSGEVGMPVGR